MAKKPFIFVIVRGGGGGGWGGGGVRTPCPPLDTHMTAMARSFTLIVFLLPMLVSVFSVSSLR